MIELLPRPFYHFEWWFEILKIYHGLLSCAMVSSHLYSGKEKKPQCLLMVSNSNLPELKKKKKTTEKGHSFTFSSLPSTPSFTLFLCSSARQMLAVTSQHDMASFSKELLLITALPAVSDNSVMPTHSQLCL